MSSPLILSFNVSNDAEVERLWPIIANKQALDINEQWAGQAGQILKLARTNITGTACSSPGHHKAGSFPAWAVWSKRLSDPPNSLAVLAINIAETPQSFEVSYDELAEAAATGATDEKQRQQQVRGKKASFVSKDVWTGKVDKQPISPGEAWSVQLTKAHSSIFKVFSPAAAVAVK